MALRGVTKYEEANKYSLFIADHTRHRWYVSRFLCTFAFKVAYTSGLIFEKIMKRYPIFSVHIINYQIDQMHK